MYENSIELLREHFNTLSEAQFADIRSCITIKKVKKKEIIAKQGDVYQDLCYVGKGLFKNYSLDSSLTPQVISFSTEKYWLSDLYSYVTGEGSLTTITALEDGEILILSKENLEALFLKHHDIETHFRKLLEKRVARLYQDKFNMMSLNAKERYENFIKHNENLVQRILQKDIASHLGIFPESLSRIRKSMVVRKSNKK
jgi:CRP-like cAMP-binding protein